MISKINKKIVPSDRIGIFHNSKKDVETLSLLINQMIRKINELIDHYNKLIDEKEQKK